MSDGRNESSLSLENLDAKVNADSNRKQSEKKVESGNIFEYLPSQITISPMQSSLVRCFDKIYLHETEDMLFYEQNCCTVLRDTADIEAHKRENERYDNLVSSKEKLRRASSVETQTVDCHFKTRLINTDYNLKSIAGAFVSNYDMYDTYTDLGRKTESVQIDIDNHCEQLNITTYTTSDCSDLSQSLGTNKSFRLSSMILQRILAGNVFCENQKRFRNMQQSRSLQQIVHYSYRIKQLCRYRCFESCGNAVSCMSWNPKNTDILAVGYGVFKNQSHKERCNSTVCLWNIKVGK